MAKILVAIMDIKINHITASLGAIPISLLEKKTGYSSRWINMKFREKLGISAKSFGALTRFSHCYQLMADKNGHAGFYENDLDDLYYDKSHFLKDFKRFTGFAPAILEAHNNEFGRSYYQH